MTPIVGSVEIGRAPDEVFPYVTDPSRFGEWQEGVVSGHTEGPPSVGSKCMMTRRIGGTERTSTSEITEISPPTSWAIRGIDGPIRANVNISVEPLDQGTRSRVTISLEFMGRGAGKMVLPVVVREARKEVPQSCAKLKERLESGA